MDWRTNSVGWEFYNLGKYDCRIITLVSHGLTYDLGLIPIEAAFAHQI